MITGALILLLLLFGLLKFWFWVVTQNEIKEGKKIVEELIRKNTQKLTTEEQFQFIDGELGWKKIETILGKNEISMLVLDYFIDVKPDEYLKHLKENNPPNYWQAAMYENGEISKISDGYEINYYDHGKKSSTITFSDYDQVLRYLVFERLTNLAEKYRKSMDKSYYA